MAKLSRAKFNSVFICRVYNSTFFEEGSLLERSNQTPGNPAVSAGVIPEIEGLENMNGERSVEAEIRSFIAQKFPGAKKLKLSDDTRLLQSGIIDSLGILDVVAFIEQSLLISVSDDELTPDNFDSIRSLISFVDKKRVSAKVPAA